MEHNFFMKKFIILLILLLLIVVNSPNVKSEFSLKTYFKDIEITTYTKENLGEGNLLPTVSASKSGKVIGETLFSKNLELGSALKTLRAKVLKTEFLPDENLTVILAHSDLINSEVKLNDMSINLQIAVSQDYIVIGWPMILGGF